jgi:hypothetical protein
MKRAWIFFAFLCLAQAAACEEDRARMRFFLDLSSKAPQPGYEIQFIFVIWNEGRVAAENVRLPVPLLQLEPYEHLSHLTYVRESMSINREYHPNTSEESYFFVPRQPLTDIQDGDEGTYDESSNTVTFTMGRMEPSDYVVWAFRATVDADAPCEEAPYVQNWVTLSADNSPAYENDIIGHIVCEAPMLTALKEADVTEASPGDEIVYTITYSLDETVVEGIDPERFDVRRVRIYDTFPSEYLEIVSIGNGGEERDGAVFWQIDRLENGGSGSVSWTARVKDGVPPGTAVTNTVDILSQNTVEDQNVGSTCTVTVTSP